MTYTKKLNNFLIFYTTFYLLAFTIDFCYVLFTKNLLSDFTLYHLQTGLDSISLIFIYLHSLFYYFLGILLFFFIQNRKYNFNYFVKYKFNRFTYVLIIGFLFQIFFAFKFKIGSAGGHSGSKFSMFMNLLSLDGFFYVYYFIFRDKISKRFVFIVLIYCALKIIQGWSGFVLMLFFAELYYRYTNKKINSLFFLLIPIFIFVGALLYQHMYPLKTFIRIGEYVKISYLEALVKLVTRISCYSNSCVAYEKLDELINLNNSFSREHAELLYYFNPILPSFVYDKSFHPLNSLLLKARFSEAGFSNFDLGSIYYLLLWKISKLDFILYFTIVILNSCLYRFFLQITAQTGSYVSYVFVTYYCTVFLSGSALNMQSTWLISIFSFILFFCFGIVKLYKKRGRYALCN